MGVYHVYLWTYYITQKEGLSNKRPIILLNVVYKIEGKVFQIRLIPFLQKFISAQQYAFVWGRNIHHSLLFVNELLFQAERSNQNFMLIKLDTVKAFEKLERFFLLRILEKFGLDGSLPQFFRATYIIASSAVSINVGASTPIMLKNSIAQGCALSPLLFIITIDALSKNFNYKVECGCLEGVTTQEIDLHQTHSMQLCKESYVIDQNVVLLLLGLLGQPLDYTLIGVNLMLLVFLFLPIHPKFLDFSWQWECVVKALNLLAIRMGKQISERLSDDI